MDERELREWIDAVRAGALSRRPFTGGMRGLAVRAPRVAEMLASAGVARAKPKGPAFTPPRRGGGGELKVLWWQGPTVLNPPLSIGVKEGDGWRIFYEPLISFDPDG